MSTEGTELASLKKEVVVLKLENATLRKKITKLEDDNQNLAKELAAYKQQTIISNVESIEDAVAFAEPSGTASCLDAKTDLCICYSEQTGPQSALLIASYLTKVEGKSFFSKFFASTSIKCVIQIFVYFARF